jgi:O-antigen/teichoic acid export membrane protein
MKTELLLSGLRALGLALRLSLSLFVVAVMGLEVFGTLSLLLALTALAAPLAAMGLHYRINRDIVDAPARVMADRLRDRVALNTLAGAGLALLLGLAAPFLPGAALSGQGLTVFLILCVLEVVLADAQNLLISCRRVVLAALLLFVRSALWVPPMMLTVQVTGWSGLDPVLWFWLGGTVAALAVMAAGLSDWPWREALRGRPALRAQFAGFRLSAGIWLSDVSVAATPVIERSILLALLGPVAGGGYIFFWTLANGILQIVTASVVFPSVPMLVAATRETATDFRRLVLGRSGRAMTYAAGAGAILTAAAALGLDRLGRPELAGLFHVLPLLLAGTALICVAEVMRLALYALRRDRALILSNLAMVSLNTALVALAAALAGASAVALVPALVAAGIAALRWRWIVRTGA